MTAFSFSYAPKASTALASINPIQSRGEGLRFAANTPMEFLKQNPEIVTEGFWKGRQALTEGIVKGVTSALSGVSGALTSKAQEAKATADSKLEHDRAIEIAKIKAAPTAAETAYQQQRSDLLAQQIKAATVKNENVTATESTGSLVPREVDFFSDLESIPDFGKQPVETPAPAGKPAVDVNSAPPSPSAAPVVPNAPVAPAGVSQFAPGDSGRGLFQFDQGTQTDASGNVPPRQTSMEFNLPEPAPAMEVATSAPPKYESMFNRGEQVAAAPTESNLFSNISNISEVAPAQTQSIRGEGYQLPVAESSSPKFKFPETKGQLVLNGVSLPLAQVQGAEGVPVAKTPAKPLEGTTPPPVESALPQQVPTEPVEAKAVPFTQDQVRYYLEDKYTSRPYQSPADANMAKKLLEQKLGVKVEIDTEKGEKGTRLYHVKIVGDAPAAKTPPEGFFTKKITDADGKETYVYEPKMPVEQQVQSVNVAIDRAKTLKTAISEIRGIIGGISPGVGGAANLMAKLPFQTDASTVESLNETIKGIIGFQELVDLKAAGGSLGALSDAELKMLTSLQGSLDVKNLHRDKYLAVLKNIETRASDVEKKMEAHKKDLMTVEKPTNFQSIQSPENRVQIKTQAEFNALKSGQKFIFNGRPGTK